MLETLSHVGWIQVLVMTNVVIAAGYGVRIARNLWMRDGFASIHSFALTLLFAANAMFIDNPRIFTSVGLGYWVEVIILPVGVLLVIIGSIGTSVNKLPADNKSPRYYKETEEEEEE